MTFIAVRCPYCDSAQIAHAGKHTAAPSVTCYVGRSIYQAL
jgi:hypothetical protein